MNKAHLKGKLHYQYFIYRQNSILVWQQFQETVGISPHSCILSFADFAVK